MKNVLDQYDERSPFQEWVFYDGHCSLCMTLSYRIKKTLNSRGFGLTPLQSNQGQRVTAHLSDPLKEMLVQTIDHQLLGGADAVIYVAGKIWWMYGVYLLAQLPWMRGFMRGVYALVAKNRYCLSNACAMDKL